MMDGSTGRIIVIGGTGVIGSATVAAALKNNCDVIATSRKSKSTNQISFELLTDNIVDAVPDLNEDDQIILLAGYSAMSWICENLETARALNVDATIRLVDQCQSRIVPVYFMSTDQVFDGKGGCYDEIDEVTPLNVYGKMKVEVENHLLSSSDQNCIMRTGWNVPQGLTSHCAVKDAYQHLLNGDARMAVDNFINITDARETGQAVIELTRMKHRPNIVHLTACPPVSRKNICEEIIAESMYGADMSFQEIQFSDLSYTEPRPKNAWMNNALAIEALGLKFSPPQQTIRMKVRILDMQHTKKIQ